MTTLQPKTCEAWLKEMRDVPCYRPCPPFYDVCNNMDQEGIDRMNCDECFKAHNLSDTIE